MNKILYCFIILGLFFSFSAAAQDRDDEFSSSSDVRIPEGMKLEKVGDVNIVVPYNGGVRREGNMIFIEDGCEYASKEFIKVDERIEQLQNEIQRLREEIDTLKQDMKEGKR